MASLGCSKTDSLCEGWRGVEEACESSLARVQFDTALCGGVRAVGKLGHVVSGRALLSLHLVTSPCRPELVQGHLCGMYLWGSGATPKWGTWTTE